MCFVSWVARIDAQSHCLHLFDFSSECDIKCVFKLPGQEVEYSQRLHLFDFSSPLVILIETFSFIVFLSEQIVLRFGSVITICFSSQNSLQTGQEFNIKNVDSMNQKVKVTFCLKMVLIPLKIEKILFSTSTVKLLHSAVHGWQKGRCLSLCLLLPVIASCKAKKV